MACFHDSMSSIGNTSMSSFLSTLMENEEVNVFAIVVDNCKPDHNNSCTSLTLVEKEQPKCRWTNLVRSDSELSMGSARRSASDLSLGSRRNRSRTNRLSINRPSMKSHRSASENCLDLQMPKRIQSPTKTSPSGSPNMSRFNSDTQLLRMPQRRPSPTPQRKTLARSESSFSSMNASWSVDEIKDTTTEKKNPFLDIVSKTNDLASKGSLFRPLSPCKLVKQSRKATLATQMLAL